MIGDPDRPPSVGEQAGSGIPKIQSAWRTQHWRSPEMGTCGGMTGRTTVHTIGHSNHPLDRSIALLRDNGIVSLCDVRSHPYSRWAPHFNKNALSQSLEADGIEYLFIGNELGGRPSGTKYYDQQGHIDFERRALAPDFLAGIDRLLEIARRSPTAIMCAEEDPGRCHRRHLITPVLLRMDISVLHIRGDGRVQSEDELREAGAQLAMV